MKPLSAFFIRLALFVLTLLIWIWTLKQAFSFCTNLLIILTGVLLVFPLVWLGRWLLDKNPSASRAAWITTLEHVALMIFLGAAILRAIVTQQEWAFARLPVPTEIGMLLVILSGVALALSVVNLALKGLGAPFAIALSQKIAVDWLYAYTRNPMILAILAFLISLGLRFQSFMFVLWALLLVTPAWLFFAKVYEERELEIRFGAPYLEYKARTPFLFPRKPKNLPTKNQ